ncbi:hypothetical protein ABIA32_001104 [Streptacidiphilus sp. MAP12-20]|uniref:hypothetical protein n=1 Tax=Streptacidiphilus sp. MAP12-20 TaxID=3156299 RepID=UPI0035159CB3
MRVSRTHSVIAGIALAATVASGTFVATAEAAQKPSGGSAHHALVPAADPSTALGVLGKLGAVQSLIGQLTAMASAKPAPSPADLQALVDKLTAAITDLKASLPASPLPVGSGKSGPSGLPPLPIPNPLGDALTKLQSDVTALVAAITSADPAKITAALTSTVTDLLAVVTQTVASLGLSLPLPVAHR